MIKINAQHIRAAQAVKKMSITDFAKFCGIGRRTLARALAGDHLKEATWKNIQTELEANGFVILKDGIRHGTLFKEVSKSHEG